MIDNLEIRLAEFRKNNSWFNGDTLQFDDTKEYYHYTSFDGMKKIIENKSLRLTRSDFLNDKEEVFFSSNLIKEILKTESLSKECMTQINGVLDQIEKYLIESKRIFIISFSNDDDSTALWDRYGNNGGYNIKFKNSFFEKICKMIYLELVPSDKDCASGYRLSPYMKKVIYDSKEKIKLIFQEIEYCEKVSINHAEKSKSELPYLLYLYDLAVYSKRNGHSSENEFRIVFKFDNDDLFQHYCHFNDYKGMFRPQCEMKIDLNDIEEIKVGPKLDIEIAERGLREYLDFKRLKYIKTSKSLLKIR